MARKITPFVAAYPPNGSFVDFSGLATGDLNDKVLRDRKVGQLTFLYKVDLNDEGYTSAAQGSQLTVSGFSSYQTLPAGQLQFPSSALVFRTSDGAALRFDISCPGHGDALDPAVKTNAARYDATSRVSFALSDEFRVNGAVGEGMDLAPGNVALKHSYLPKGIARYPGGAGGTTTIVAVPLPSAFYTGLGVLMACGIIGLGRRLMGN